MDMIRILNVDGTLIDPKKEPKLPEQELLKWYEVMVATRLFDEKGWRLQRQGRVSFHVPTTGQEAVVAAAAALKNEDWIFPAYREHACFLYRFDDIGKGLEELVNHIFCNAHDPQRGRRIPGLFGNRSIGFVNPSAPIGTQIIHAAGAGYAAKYLKDGNVTIVFFGDGATSSNDFHSGMNFAAVKKTPTVFVCMNNQWAISVPLSEQTAAKSLADKAIAYGMPGVQIDGNDVFAFHAAVSEAAERARQGEGPTMIEAVTYRLGSHTSSDDWTRYRSKEEVEQWRKREPITRFKLYLLNKKYLTEKKAQNIWEKYDQLLDELIEKAEKAPLPKLETMFTEVYAEMPWHIREQYEEAKRFHGEV